MNGGVAGCVAVPRGSQVWTGTVRSVFTRSAHMETDSGFVTLGSLALSPHPCAILWAGFAPGWMPGQHVHISSRELRTEDGRVVPLHRMQRYAPSFSSTRAAGKLAVLGVLRNTGDALTHMPSQGGFHDVFKKSLGSAPRDSDSQLSGTVIRLGRRLGATLAAAMRRHDWEAFRSAADALAGLGEGLTPSGDDFLGGVFAAMRYHGKSTGSALFPDTLTNELACRLTAKTTPFSGFLLRLSAKGLVGLPFSRWLRAAHEGDVAAALASAGQAAAIGHSSGLDALVGMLLSLQILNGEEPWTGY